MGLKFKELVRHNSHIQSMTSVSHVLRAALPDQSLRELNSISCKKYFSLPFSEVYNSKTEQNMDNFIKNPALKFSKPFYQHSEYVIKI